MLEVQARELGLDHLEALWGHEIMRGNRAVRQVVIDLAAFGFLGESLAHQGTIPCRALRLWLHLPLRGRGNEPNKAGSLPLLDPGFW